MRSLHILLFHKLNSELTYSVEAAVPTYWKQLKEIPLAQELVLSCAVDMILQPLHVAESRFIMQNRRSNFAAYSSLLNYFRTTPLTDLMRANLIHLPRNFLVALQGLRITDQISMASYYGQVVISQTLAYPFLTVQRQKECLTGSDRLRGRGFTSLAELGSSSSFFALARRIFSEEGIKGFYRGYLTYIFAIVFWAAALPSATDAMMNVVPFLQSLRNRKSREELLK